MSGTIGACGRFSETRLLSGASRTRRDRPTYTLIADVAAVAVARPRDSSPQPDSCEESVQVLGYDAHRLACMWHVSMPSVTQGGADKHAGAQVAHKWRTSGAQVAHKWRTSARCGPARAPQPDTAAALTGSCSTGAPLVVLPDSSTPVRL